MPKTTDRTWIKHPSWWIVVIAGLLLAVFTIAIVREIINSQKVKQQVARLQDEVATEQQRQNQLQDLIDYLGSPTFQEQEARLKLGLKKSDEQVIVLPTTNVTEVNINDDQEIVDVTGRPISNPGQWWKYLFSSRT